MIYTTKLSIVSLPLVVKIWPLLVYCDCLILKLNIKNKHYFVVTGSNDQVLTKYNEVQSNLPKLSPLLSSHLY